MSGTYRKINYSLRLAKKTERNMICDMLRPLSELGSLESWQYIGLGSTYFSDFTLFHKSLCIRKMTSIEEDKHAQERFEFNKPFHCIEMAFGKTTAVLPTLDWDFRTIAWLDYDSKLTSDVLSDAEIFVRKIARPSFLLLTVNVEPPNESSFVKKQNDLVDEFGKAIIPGDLKEKDLKGWNFAKLCRRIIKNRIWEVLMERNSSIPEHRKMKTQQVLFFEYRDDARMMTLGFVFYDAGQEHLISKCNFKSFPFYRDEDEPFQIEMPKLTLGEIRYLNTILPQDPVPCSWIPERDIRQYTDLYRYFPNFVDADI